MDTEVAEVGTTVEYVGRSSQQARNGELFVVVNREGDDYGLGRLVPDNGWTYQWLTGNRMVHLVVSKLNMQFFVPLGSRGKE